METLSCLEGIKIKGEGAHQQIIDYICDKYRLDQSTKQFIQEMRDYRNRISYEGFIIKEDYIKTNSGKIERIIDILLKLVEERLT